ncbi:YhdT family protein [Maledivibacter halophilus]|uniref:YhdT family protein n=1 Tax=Maledivibacter halophilus TaxID=36842 RepID=UPI001AD93172|nr:YhdT family protein [Maledivibacter halophilus]
MDSKKKNKILRREALITIGLYIFFFMWWYVFAYGLGSKEPSQYSYVFGFPGWFFYSCILGYVVICLLLWFVVKKFFVEVDFDED